jgi:2-polyprenyl-6-methoxyphenol hydroxylase-like FAD-dependent oxidoreductase
MQHTERADAVGADGRTSSVRRQLGLGITQTPPNSLGGGILVEDLHDWPRNVTSIGTEGDLLYFVFPRAGAKARLYLLHDAAQKGRFSGPRRRTEFLEAFRFRCIPNSEMFAKATPAASCSFYPMNDAWTECPYAPGAVLIGDAAGWTDPVIGQGLSIALRDARLVRDALWENRNWTPEIFEPYAAPRRTAQPARQAGRRRHAAARAARRAVGPTGEDHRALSDVARMPGS